MRYCLNPRQLCDLELLLNGGFHPLQGFLNEADYESVLDRMQLVSGELWPMPITLDVPSHIASQLSVGQMITLCDQEGLGLAEMSVESIWKPDKKREALKILATLDERHPGVRSLLQFTEAHYIGGTLKVLHLPVHHDFVHLRQTPQQLKERFKLLGWEKIVAFQTRNPMHHAHQAMTLQAVRLTGAHLLIHPAVGMTKPGDVDHYTRVRCYEKILKYYPENTVMLSLLPLAMRMAGPREALWHAIIRCNYGCTHFIVGRDHAGPGLNAEGKPFYDPYAAQNLAVSYQKEIGITVLPFQEMVYVRNKQCYLPLDETNDSDEVECISGTELRRRLCFREKIPEWFSFPDVIAELQQRFKNRGSCVFFTGLSGSGKSTLAKALQAKLLEIDYRPVTLLDGDVVRRYLSQELGFSKADRDMNVLRMAYVASEVVKHGGMVICAPIAPYEVARKQAREIISEHGDFLEIYVSTPLAVCEDRDPKGLYQKARQGSLKGFTGIDDPYEVPSSPDLVLNTDEISLADAVHQILFKFPPFERFRVAMVEIEGAPVEFIETKLSEEEIWGTSHKGSVIYPEKSSGR